MAVQHVLSLSYGKDSLACLGAIEHLGWPLDRIVHAEVWATDTIPADLPPMVEFKARTDQIIKECWGIEVEHIRAKNTFEGLFYRVFKGKNERFKGKIRGFPNMKRNWCNGELKEPCFSTYNKGNIVYIGIAADEPSRFHNLSEKKKSPLVEAGWTEERCRTWCEERNLLSPIYTTMTRGGCWFCHNQRIGQLRLLRQSYPEYWALMMKWDADSPVTFTTNGHTVRDFDVRFRLEDEGKVPTDRKFRWCMVEEALQRDSASQH